MNAPTIGFDPNFPEDRLIDRIELSRLTGFTPKTIQVYDSTRKYDFRPIKSGNRPNARVRYRLSHILKLIEDWELGIQ